MSNSNVNKFNEITGAVFAKLYENFPLPTPLLAQHFCEVVTVEDDFMGEVPSEETLFFCATIQWLQREGFIYYRSEHIFGASDAGLTNKCFELLKKTPTSLEPSIGDQLTEAVKSETKEGLRTFASALLSQAATAILG